ncbi:MAG: methyltransferase domain-containing protein [Chloroflexota bacterium]
MGWFVGIVVAGLLGVVVYWLVVTTEGVFLGQRTVVWLYDRTAKQYDGIKQFDAGAERFFVIQPLLLNLTHLPAPRVLDVATGTGRLPYFLLNEPHFHGRVVGLDPADKMLRLAQQKLAGYRYRLSLVQQTAVPLPFSDNSFDAITCLEALEFLPSDREALQEMVRVLRPGGVLLVTRRRGWEAKLFFGRYWTKEGFEDYLRSLGLKGVNTQLWQVDYDQVFAYKPTG